MFLESSEKKKKAYPAHDELDAINERNSLGMMASLVGEGKRVLDMGCASGYFARFLSRRGCDVVGFDINPVAVEEARRFCSNALVVDLDRTRARDVLPEGQRFDVIVFGDVLEHLREPIRALDEARLMLAEGGYVVASIPNIAHGAIRLALLAGAFDYQEFGILDDTHLRFFTAKSVEELFLSAGFRIARIERTKLPVFEPSDLVPAVDRADFHDGIVAEVLADPESDTLQFVIQAIPIADNARVRSLAKRFLEVNTNLAAAQRGIARREREIEAERRRREEVERELEQTRRYLKEADEEMRRAQADHLAATNALHVAREQQAAFGALRSDHDHLRGEYAALVDRLTIAERRVVEIELDRVRLSERIGFTTREAERLSLAEERANQRADAADAFAAESAKRLDDTRERMAQAVADAARFERYEFQLTRELQEMRAEATSLRVRADKAEYLASEQAAALERREAELIGQLEATRVETERLVAERTTAFERREAELIGQLEATRVEIERLAAERTAAFERREAEFAAQLAVMNAESTELRARADEAERLLANHLESALAESQAESARLALLIDSVQSSWFWRLKRRLASFF